MLANGFRRKGGAGELIARILLYPLFAVLALLPTAVAGVLAWYFAVNGQLAHVVWILWGTVALMQLVNINLGQPGTTFDPTELIRFPMPLHRFVLVRLTFGLLAPANVLVLLMSVAIAVGLCLGRPGLWWAACLSLAAFALVNILFTRMIFAWIDRWLSTRRARECFTAFIFVSSIGIQYLNVRFNPGFQPENHWHARSQLRNQFGDRRPGHRAPSAADIPPGTRHLGTMAERLEPYAFWLPPELTANAVQNAAGGKKVDWLVKTGGTLGFALVFLLVYGFRMRTEFRGEALSDTAIATKPLPSPNHATAHTLYTAADPLALHRPSFWARLVPQSFAALIGKEFLVLRRNVGLFYGLVAPAVMVFLFAGRISSRGSSHWVVLGGVAYALLGIASLSYNAFGTEGTGAQFYFHAPVPLREIFFAKNMFGLALAFVEVLFVLGITGYVAGRPQPNDCVFALLWALGTVLLTTTLGNLRSVSAPKRVKPGRSMSKAQSAVSGYIALGILAACIALGYACEWLALFLHRTWVGTGLMAIFAAIGIFVYLQGLAGIEAYALERRDTLFQELGKKT